MLIGSQDLTPPQQKRFVLSCTEIVYGYCAQQAADVFPCNRQFLSLKILGRY